MKLRLAFMGTPEFAVPSLEALRAAGHELAVVYSQPPRPAGRGQHVLPSPVHRAAAAASIPVRTPRTLRDPAEQAFLAGLDLDAAIVAAYGLILPKPILEAPRLGCLNVHASLLPRWRGAAPIQRAILAGDGETGITIMQMDEGLDTGPMLLREAVPIAAETRAADLHDRLASLGARLVVEAVHGIAEGGLEPVPQPAEGVTYAPKLTRDEGRLDWREDAALLARKVRALNPWPGVWLEHGSERIRVLEGAAETGASGASGAAPGTVVDARCGIACGHGVFRPQLVQRAGRAPLDIESFLRGYAIPAGSILPCPATS